MHLLRYIKGYNCPLFLYLSCAVKKQIDERKLMWRNGEVNIDALPVKKKAAAILYSRFKKYTYKNYIARE